MQYQRVTALMVSDELPKLLQRWYRPPTQSRGHQGLRPSAATKVLVSFAQDTINREIDQEMKRSANLFVSGPDLSKEHILSLNFHALIDECRLKVPIMWSMFRKATYTAEQDEHKIHKNPNMVSLPLSRCTERYSLLFQIVLSMISQCHYTRSYRRAHLAKAWAIYLKACGMSARAFDAVHSLGLTMSHKWTADAFRALSNSAMEEVRELVKSQPFFLSYDNVNIPLRVFLQRLHNQSHFQNGCAGTAWILPSDAVLASSINALLQETCRTASSIPDITHIIDGNTDAKERLRARYIHQILLVLLESPEFRDYPVEKQKHQCLSPPPPVHELAIGEERQIQQFMLETAPIEEASYDGNDKVIAEWFRQLKLDSKAEQRRTGLDRIIVCCGDQLTMDRLRGLYKFRSEDYNSFDRMDYLVLSLGWFHVIMAFASSLYKQYYGSSSSVGQLRHAFDVLHKKKMSSPASKGPFWNDLDEALRHISEAHFRLCWLELTGTDNLDQLKTKTPEELRSYAADIHDRYASMSALVNLRKRLTSDDRDLVQENSIMWNADILPYLELTAAIKHGDVGRMEDLLPTVLFRFAGGGNFKYTVEMLELIQCLHHEWPLEVRNFVQEHCWVINLLKLGGMIPSAQRSVTLE